MPPEFRNVRPGDAVAAFERAGGVVRRGRGSHINVKMPNGQVLTFPQHREPLKIGLLKAMLRKAEITEEQFDRLLRGD